MLDGWYCRSMANEAAAAEEEEQAMEESQCKKQYKFLKRKFKNLLYENECFREALRASQKRLLAVTRDRNFLLDRLLQFEKTESSSESEETESSDEEIVRVISEPSKKRKLESNGSIPVNNVSTSCGGKVVPPAIKRKKTNVQLPKQIQPVHQQQQQHQHITNKQNLSHSFMQLPINSLSAGSILSDGHMTPEEVERHLQSRQTYIELMPERTPLTVPTEMFSNEPSLDSESNDIGELETSPSNIGEELSIDMIVE